MLCWLHDRCSAGGFGRTVAQEYDELAAGDFAYARFGCRDRLSASATCMGRQVFFHHGRGFDAIPTKHRFGNGHYEISLCTPGRQICFDCEGASYCRRRRCRPPFSQRLQRCMLMHVLVSRGLTSPTRLASSPLLTIGCVGRDL